MGRREANVGDGALIDLTPDQIAAADKIVRYLVTVEPRDRVAAIVNVVNDYAKSLRAEHTDVLDETILGAVDTFFALIIERYNEFTKLTVDGQSKPSVRH